MGTFDFNLADYTPADQAEVVPAGTYKLMCVEEQTKPTASGNGTRLLLTWEVLEGQHKGAKIFEGLNIVNPSEVAQRISRRILKSIELAAGLNGLQDSAQLVNKIVTAEVGIEEPRAGADGKMYSERNKVLRYLKSDSPAALSAPTAARWA